MADLKPTIKTNFYGFDYYEVAYTCLATQHPTLGNFKFPNLTFANDSEYVAALANVPIHDAPIAQTVGDVFSQNITNKDVITINDARANNVITNNIGVEFYTENWKNALDLCKEINTFHTWNVDIGGNYPTEEQRSKVRRLLWNKWWKNLLYADIDVSEFFLLGLRHSLDMKFLTSETIDEFNQWLEDEKVCEDTKTQLLNYFASLPSIVPPEFNDIEEILTTPLNAIGVYHIIEKIDAKSTVEDCYSPYNCLNSATPGNITNLSDGTESETCVTYWLSSTPPTSSLSGTYIPLSGACDSLSISTTGEWTKYKSITTRRPRFDFIKIKGRLITPNETFVTRNGISIVKAQDLYDSCANNYDAKVSYTPFLQSFESPYGECCVVLNGKDKNWNMTASINNPYGIQVIPRNVGDSEGSVTIILTQKFFNAMKSDPALLNTEFIIDWNIKLQVSGACLANKIIESYRANFYPYCKSTQLYYEPNCGIIFNDAEGFSNGNISNALNALNEMQGLVRKLFVNIYNCYAREVSKSQIYGDIIKVVGRFYDEHGSECWYLLKQVLRPEIAQDNIVEDEQLKGFDLPNQTLATPTIITNQVLPDPTPTPSVNLSNLFKKGNKLCSTLSTPLKYK